jgi:hypothetical protein
VVFHNEPLETPPLNVVLKGNVEVFCFSPVRKLQAYAANELVLSPSHPEAIMIEVF